VGLKQGVDDQLLRRSRLSAEPLVGLKLPARRPAGTGQRLSAEPLVGLKQRGAGREYGRQVLSAEPLVGLKLTRSET